MNLSIKIIKFFRKRFLVSQGEKNMYVNDVPHVRMFFLN